MMRKNHIYIIVTGIMAITLVWLSQSNKNGELKFQPPINKKTANNIANESTSTLEGVLWSSDDKAKGNLMLIDNKTAVYIKTARDFSNLTGKQVIIYMDGALDNFVLINIEENLTRNGFIQTQ